METTNNKKYDIRICKCGRIHAISKEKIERAIDENKNFLLICASCGKGTLIGADACRDYLYPGETAYMGYAVNFSNNNKYFKPEELLNGTDKEKPVAEIFYDRGYGVPMKTGQYATVYFNGNFSDGWYPDFYKIQRSDIAAEEIVEFIKRYSHDRNDVNMDRFINETPDDVLEALSHYIIEGLDWKGTKYKKEWN